ncbi:MAG TPA: hypothetical protein VFE32_08150 [Puia sp.]|nr:hypothetical protein [Puia sp.]
MRALRVSLAALNEVADGLSGDGLTAHEQLVAAFMDLCLQCVEIGVYGACFGLWHALFGRFLKRPAVSHHTASLSVPSGGIPCSMNGHFFHYSVDGDSEIDGSVNIRVTVMLFVVKKQTKTLLDHTQVLLNW